MMRDNNMHAISRQNRLYARTTTTSKISRNDDNDPQFKKLSWLRSQIIGQNVDFISPFGKRILTYADHTASGRSLYYIEDYIINNVLPFYGNTHTSDSYVGYRTTKVVNKSTSYIKKCLGGGEDDALLFCGSGTTSAFKKLQEMMGITVPSIMRKRVIKCLGKEERWVVFVGPFEHHSNILSWRESLAQVVEIGLNEDGLLDMEALKKKLEFYRSRGSKRRPILGSFSACSNVTGICSDTRGIASLFHQFGGFACFDYAASGPYTKIDMRSTEIDGYDAIFISPHKFIGGPGSPGILLVNKALYRLKSSPPSTCGGGTVAYVNGFNAKDTWYVDNIEEREDAGTPAITQKIRAALAFWVKEYIGYKIIQNKEQSHIKQALNKLLQNPNIKVLGNTTSRREAILSFLVYPSSPNSSLSPLANVASMNRGDLKGKLEAFTYINRKPLHGPFVAKILNDLFGIQARGGCACAGPYGHSLLNVDESQSLAIRSTIKKGHNGVKPGWARISFPYYMSNEEFEFILEAVQFILIYGQRFLPLYHFNWNSGEWTFNKKKMANGNMLLTKRIIDNLPTCDSSSVSINSSHKASRNETLRFEYTKYLEIAKLLADCLPEFLPPRYIPKEIDPDLVYFRV